MCLCFIIQIENRIFLQFLALSLNFVFSEKRAANLWQMILHKMTFYMLTFQSKHFDKQLQKKKNKKIEEKATFPAKAEKTQSSKCIKKCENVISTIQFLFRCRLTFFLSGDAFRN